MGAKVRHLDMALANQGFTIVCFKRVLTYLKISGYFSNTEKNEIFDILLRCEDEYLPHKRYARSQIGSLNSSIFLCDLCSVLSRATARKDQFAGL